MNNRLIFGTLTATLLLGGCAIGPDYTRPEAPKNETFRDANGSAPLDAQWWKGYNDPLLSRAIEEALRSNYDLKSAQSKVDALLGKFDQAKSYLYPQINGGGSLTRKGTENVTSTNQPNLREGITSTYAASLSLASYEIDLFGKVRRANEAARALLLSSDYARESVRLSVAAGVAASYIKLSSIQSQIELARENLKTSREILEMTDIRYRHGAIDQSVYYRAESEYASAQATLSQLEASKRGEESLYNQLLSRHPRSVETSPLETIAIPPLPEALPSTVLTRRPDIAAAEQNLIAANAQIGIARAAYFPSIRLTGMLGIQSSDLSDFVSNPTRLWELVPSITVPIFSAGRISGEIKSAEAEHEVSLAAYQKAILAAFNDTDNALGQHASAADQMRYQQERAQAIQKALEHAKLRYRVGSISYTDMLSVQQQWLAAQQAYLIARQNTLSASVGLYKALGGGWDAGTSIPEPDYLPAGR